MLISIFWLLLLSFSCNTCVRYLRGMAHLRESSAERNFFTNCLVEALFLNPRVLGVFFQLVQLQALSSSRVAVRRQKHSSISLGVWSHRFVTHLLPGGIPSKTGRRNYQLIIFQKPQIWQGTSALVSGVHNQIQVGRTEMSLAMVGSCRLPWQVCEKWIDEQHHHHDEGKYQPETEKRRPTQFVPTSETHTEQAMWNFIARKRRA